MAKVTLPQVWLSILITLVFAPVFLASGLPALAPEWVSNRAWGIPLISWLVLVLNVFFVTLVCLFAGASFGAARPDDASNGDSQ